jgi:hypothetical protein
MKCGYSIKEITPPIGCYLSGNTRVRIADGVADPLYVRAVAFEEDGLAVILCFDLIGFIQAEILKVRAWVAERLGLDAEKVLITCTHTHTAPNIHSRFFPKTEYLMTSMKDLALAAAQDAISDLKEAKASFARSELSGIAFTRRYRMRDGSAKTNPGRRNPLVAGPLSPADETIQLLKFEREEGDDIVLVNFQVHPDVRGSKEGPKISADYPGVVCKTLEGALPGTRCIYFNGTSGDLNHVDVNCPAWDKNSGPAQVLHMGRTIAGKILSMYTKARPVETGPVRTAQLDVTVPARECSPEEIATAKQYMEWYLAGEGDKIPLDKGSITVLVYEALGVVVAEESGGSFTMPVTGVAMGDISFVGIPGEAFCEIGRQIRETSPFSAHFMMGLTHGYPDYFPMKDAFEVDGYESRSSPYRSGVGEAMAEAGKRLTAELYEKSKKN